MLPNWPTRAHSKTRASNFKNGLRLSRNFFLSSFFFSIQILNNANFHILETLFRYEVLLRLLGVGRAQDC